MNQPVLPELVSLAAYVAVGHGELGIATRKSQTPGKQEAPRA